MQIMDQQSPLAVCPRHTGRYLTVSVVGVAIGVAIGWFFTYEYFEVYAPPVQESDYQAGFDAAKRRIEESMQSGAVILPSHEDIRVISGVVTAIKNNEIYFHTQMANPLEIGLEERGGYVTTDTKLYRMSKKDPKVFQAEMDAYLKATRTNKTAATAVVKPPESFTRVAIDLSSIRVGDQIEVTALENIKTKREFSASEILQLAPESIIN